LDFVDALVPESEVLRSSLAVALLWVSESVFTERVATPALTFPLETGVFETCGGALREADFSLTGREMASLRQIAVSLVHEATEEFSITFIRGFDRGLHFGSRLLNGFDNWQFYHFFLDLSFHRRLFDNRLFNSRLFSRCIGDFVDALVPGAEVLGS
jgi:hypothetical protein